MYGAGEQLRDGAVFHGAAPVQDERLVAHVPHDGQVVADEDQADANARRISDRGLSIWAWTETSSGDTASSGTSTAGSTASARAMAARWR
ncbi:hypothetical protein GCM10010433_26100 [Streptomyces pulveraceus]|uniref:Uncharacterized protein n=1 Tax=Streptomyces pulveraceus TaxID=68258 RepID=A0ABW1GE81_9ACTN